MADLVNGLGGSAGFGESSMPRNDDDPSVKVDLSAAFPGGLNFYGAKYSELWLNYNGSVTFGTSLSAFSPTSITGNTSIPIIAPYWADVDTRSGPSAQTPGGTSQGTNLVWWDLDPLTGTFTATWDDVGYYTKHTDRLNAFQLQLVPVGTKGDFDIHFRYEALQWTTGDFSGGTGGMGGLAAHAGYSSGNGVEFSELQQSGSANMLSLTGSSNVFAPGHYVFEVRNGLVSLFSPGADVVDFNNLTPDQKRSIASGNDEYHGLGGSDTIILPEPANYDQVVGKTKEGVDIKLGWTDTAASTFTTGSLAGEPSTVQAGEGNHFIVTGAGNDVVNIFGSGNNKITVGSGNATILVDVGTVNGSNTIVGGSGNETITLRSSATTDGAGTQDISVGTGSTKLTVDGRFFTNIHGGPSDASRAEFALLKIDDHGGNSPISLDGFSNATSLMIEENSALILKPGAFLKADRIRNTDGTSFEPGTIVVEAGATLEIGTKASGAVRLGSGSSTLILDDVSGVGFMPEQTEFLNLGSTFSISNIVFGDSIVLRGVSVPANPVVAATLGKATLKDGGTQLAVQIYTENELHTVAVDSVNGSTTWDNKAYFKVAESADGKDTVLTLVAGNNYEDSMGVAAARQKYGLDGTGIKVGIISDSFANDVVGYQRDVQLGILPTVTILSDNTAGNFFSGGNDEGRAMAQIIHAIAPGASLFFSTLESAGSYGFAAAVRELVAAGCNIIVDDVEIGHAIEFFDFTIAEEIDNAVDSGITFVTAATNSRDKGIEIFGHAGHSKVISVAPVNVLAAPSAAFPGGRYLPLATESTASEGTNGKPDLSGPDGGQTALPLGNDVLNPFFGTSSAAPAVAGLAALMMQYNPLLVATPKLVETVLEQTSFPFGQPTTAGAGFAQAEGAVASAYRLSPAFFIAPSNMPLDASFAAPDGLSAASAAHLKLAALSTGPGSASSDERVLLLLTMDQGVIVTGAPSLTLNTGGLATYDAALSTPSAGRLLFEYTVGSGEQVGDLRVTGLNGSIKDSGGTAADLAPLFGLPTGLTINSPLKVQSVTSTHAGVAMAGQTIEVTVTLSSGATLDTGGGAPTLTLGHGATALYDAASSNLAAGKLVFDYKIGAGEATPDVSLASIDVPLGTWLRDANGNNANLSLTLDRSTGVQVGAAFVTHVFPAFEETALPTGQTVDLTVVFSQAVVVDRSKGSPTLALGNGAAATFDAAASNVTKGVLVFEYKAGASDAATDNLMITKVALNGATIRDAGGLDADLSGAQGVATALTIHSPLTVETTTASKSGKIQIGDSVQLTITLEEGLRVIANANSGGPPTLALNDGGTAFYNALASDLAGGKLVFDYRVDVSAHGSANLAITRFDQNGAILFDSKGNFADMTGALNVATGLQVVVPDRATVAIASSNAPAAEGQAGTTTFTFLVTLGKAAALSESIKWSVTGTGLNPAAASDFAGGALPAGVLTFAPGELSKTITANVQGDAVAEADEAFVVTLSDASAGLLIGTASASGTIVNDDASVSVVAANASRAEGNAGTTAFSFTVTRTGGLGVTHVVAWSASGSGANPAAASDFAGGVLPAGAVTFGAGESTKTVIVEIAGDGLAEASEGFTLSLSNPSAGLTVGTASAVGTIVNDDASVSIAAAGAVKAEGNAGTTAFNFTVTRSGDLSVSHSVSWSVAGSGADPATASDFAGGALPSGVVTFGAGESSKTLAVGVLGDAVVEANEEFAVTLGSPSAGLTIATPSAIGTIGNDDAKVSIAASSAVKAEGNSGATAYTFTISRSGGISVLHSVSWAVAGSGGNPATASDFAGSVLPAGDVTFAAGETTKVVTVSVQGDAAGEADEAFTVSLTNPSSGLAIGTATATGTILNDDSLVLDARDDAFVTQQGKAMTATAAAGLLFNDSGATTASIVAAAGHGTLQFTSNGAFTYTPSAGFRGIDSFVYKAGNGSGTENAEVTVYVVPVVAGAATTLDLLALTAEEQIAATYAAFFGRATDAGGFGFWVGEFNRLLPVQGPAALFANIASSFGISDEAKALYPFLASPFNATDGQIGAFLQSVYTNLFNRGSDAGGLAYWTGQIKQTLQAGQFVGSVLVNIMSGAQDTTAGQDITTLMGKVAVSLEYAHEQIAHQMNWSGNSDRLAATSLLQAVTSAPQTVLTGIRTAEDLVAAHP